MIRLSLIVTFCAAAIGVSMVTVTVLPRAKPDINSAPESLPPVEYVTVAVPEVPPEPQDVKLEHIEDRLRAIQTKLTRIEGKAAEGK